MNKLKKWLATTGVYLMIVVPYILTFFVKVKGNIILGYVVSHAISILVVGRLWSKIFTWLYGDKADTKQIGGVCMSQIDQMRELFAGATVSKFSTPEACRAFRDGVSQCIQIMKGDSPIK